MQGCQSEIIVIGNYRNRAFFRLSQSGFIAIGVFLGYRNRKFRLSEISDNRDYLNHVLRFSDNVFKCLERYGAESRKVQIPHLPDQISNQKMIMVFE